MIVEWVVTREQVTQAVLDWIAATYPGQFTTVGDTEAFPRYDDDNCFDGLLIRGNALS